MPNPHKPVIAGVLACDTESVRFREDVRTAVQRPAGMSVASHSRVKLLRSSNLPAQEALVLYKGRIRVLVERLPFLPAAARANIVAELKHELHEARRLRAATRQGTISPDRWVGA